MPRGHTIKLEPVKVATMIARGMTQTQIAHAHRFASTSFLSVFMEKNLNTLRPRYDETPAKERAKAWLEANAASHISASSVPGRKKYAESPKKVFQPYAERRAPQPRSLCCPYYIGKERRVCGAHRGASPYCDTHMEATAPLVVRV